MLGRVVAAHGLRGELRVRWLGDGPENLRSVARFVLCRTPDDAGGQEFEVTSAGSGRTGEVRLSLRGVTDREAAEALGGRWVCADAAQLAPLPEGEHYWYELVGCAVETPDGRTVGRIREIWETAAHDVLVVERSDGATCLVPAARELLVAVDVAERRVVVEDRPGLFEPSDAAPTGRRRPRKPRRPARAGSDGPCSGST